MNISEIIEKLNSLPKGYISKKVIKGKEYFYLQYLDNGKLISKYIKKVDLPLIKNQIAQRKELDKLLSSYKRNKEFSLSKRSRALTGYLMSEDRICAEFRNGVLTSIDDTYAPLYIKRTKSITSFLTNRVLDLSRPNARFLLKQLEIEEKKEEYIALYSYGLTMSDHFWFKPLGSAKKYRDVCFNNDLYADIALKGKIMQLKGFESLSPEFTNIGSFEKCWKKINSQWWLYKSGKRDEIFSEYFVYKLAEKLNLPIARYELDGEYIRSLNFAEEYDFEPMFALIGDNEKYDDVLDILFDISEEMAKDYIRLLWFDALVYNVDRHNKNYGVMRSRETGDIVSLAPNFDNNLALLSYNKTLDQAPEKDGMIKLFVRFITKNDKARTLFANSSYPVVSEEIINDILNEIAISEPKDKIVNFILKRYEYLERKRINLITHPEI